MNRSTEEIRFDESQKNLFRSLGLDIESRFLYPEDPARRIHVLETGQKDPVVMIHGGNSVAAGRAPLLAELDGRFHVYARTVPDAG